MNVDQYINRVDRALMRNDGEQIASLLSIRDAHAAQLAQRGDIANVLSKRLDQPWSELFASHGNCVVHVSRFDYIKAFREQQNFIQVLVRILQQRKEENWLLPLMYSACLEIRLLGLQADRQSLQKKSYKAGECLEKSAESLMNCFRVCTSDNRPSPKESKRIGMLHLVNQLFKIYYTVNTLHLCKPLIRAIESSPFKDDFPISQQVTYRYFVGRKAVFDNDLRSANDYLTFAFQRCHPASVKNKRQILIYLIPVKMLLGYQPSAELLVKYNLTKLSAICEAVKKGNVRKFQEELDSNEAHFFQIGIYLILERLRMVLYRNLFKRVYHIMGTHQIPLEAFKAVLENQGVDDIDLSETQCLLANLIFQNKIKGYMSLQHSKLVVSRQNAFPKLSSIN